MPNPARLPLPWMTAAILVAVAMSPASGQAEEGDPDGGRLSGVLTGGKGQEFPPAPLKAPRWRAAAPELQNPDFELLDGSGNPQSWIANLAPAIREEDGNHYARVAGSSSYRQIVINAAPRQHISLLADVRSEFGFERANFLFDQFTSGDDLYLSRSVRGGEGLFERSAATISVFPERQNLAVFVRGVDDRNWVDIDNLEMISETLRNGDFENGLLPTEIEWQLENGASVVTNQGQMVRDGLALHLPSAGSASQLLTALEDGQEYFLSGEGYATSAEGTLVLTEDWQSSGLDSLEPPASTMVALGSDWTPFMWRSGNHPDASASLVSLENGGSSAIVVDNMGRGSTTVFPPFYYPGAGSANPLLQLTAVWDESMNSAEVIIRDAGETVVETVPLGIEQGIAYADWDGLGVTTGDYTAVFQLSSPSLPAVEIERAFTIRPAIEEKPVADDYTADRIMRCAWIWILRDGSTVEEIRPIFDAALEDGFNSGIVWARPDQWPAVDSICEELEFPFIAASDELNREIREPLSLTGFNRADYELLVGSEIGDIVQNPFCFGYYVVDEPEGEEFVERAGNAVGVAATNPQWKTPFLTITPAWSTPGTWDTINPPVFWTDFYPFNLDEPRITDGLRELSQHLEEQVSFARERGRSYWLVQEAFSNPEFYRIGPVGASRASIGMALAHGAQGIVPFTYRSIGGLEGLRGLDLEETMHIDVWRDQNALIASLSDTLISLENHRVPFEASGSFVVTEATSEAGTYVFGVSVEGRLENEVTLQFGSAGATLTDVATGEQIVATDGEARLTFGPGEWRLWRVDSGQLIGAQARSVEPPAPARIPWFSTSVSNTPVRSVEYSPSGERAVAGAEDGAYFLNADRMTEGSLPLDRPHRAAYVDEERLLLAGWRVGLYSVDGPPEPIETLPGFLRESGGAFDVLAEGSDVWLSSWYFGLRRLDLQGDGSLEPRAFAFSSGFLRELFGPFDDGSIIVLDTDSGIFRADLNAGDQIELEMQWPGKRLWRADLSHLGSLLAVARMRLGFSVHEIGPDGTVVRSVEHRPPLVHVEDVAWLDEDQLAVASSDGEILFYRVGEDLSVSPLAQWRRVLTETPLFAVTAREGEMAAGYGDGVIVFLDTRALLENGWLAR